MRDLIARLRAALTPQTIAWLCAVMLLFLQIRYGAGGGKETALETRVSRTLSQMMGAGRVSVVIQTKRVPQSGGFASQQGEEMPVGAVAVAQGADDPVIRMEIQEALCALLGIPASSVSVKTGGD